MEAATQSDPAALRRVKEARIGLDLAVLQHDFRKLVEREPNLFPAVHAIEKRVLETLEQSLKRRIPDGKHQYLRSGAWKKSIVSSLKNAVILASVTPKPLGAPLDKVDPARIRQAFAKQVNKCGFEKVDDAAVGQAIYDQKAQVELPFSCGLYDSALKKYFLNRSIAADEIVPDRFHLYKIGDAPITSAAYLWTMRSWRSGINLGSLYTAGEALDKEYEIWLSLKFEGTGYHPESTAEQNRVWVDRVVVVAK